MQPENFAAVVPEPVDEVDEELGLAQPVATKATAASAAAAWKAFLTYYLLFRGACCRPLRERFSTFSSPAPFCPGATGARRSQAPCVGMIAG
jgi:hypothetical protein